jgi:hypothetical protein
MWSSSSLQDTTQFNYTYPEFQGIDMNDPSTPAYIMRLIEYLYNDGPRPSPPIRTVGEVKVRAAHEALATGAASIQGSTRPLLSTRTYQTLNSNMYAAAVRETNVQKAPGSSFASVASITNGLCHAHFEPIRG